jgi:hypothetical protein
MSAVESNRWFSESIALIRAEYLEMPGLALTKCEMRRLWALDASACDAIVDMLVGSSFLYQCPDNSFMRRDRRMSGRHV